MMKKDSFIIFMCSLVGFVYADTDVSGFVKLNYLNYKNQFDLKNNSKILQENRVTILKSVNDYLTIEGAYKIVQSYSNTNDSGLVGDYSHSKRTYRVDDFNLKLTKKGRNYFLGHNFDLATLTWAGEVSSVILGRQQIAFGNARLVNPTDIFTPFHFTEIDMEVRSGVDAIRFRRQIGVMGEIDIGVIFGENLKKDRSAVYGSTKVETKGHEIRTMVAKFQEASMMGFDLGTSIWGASIWLENAWVKPKYESSYFRSVFGGDYQVTSETSLFLEYHYNGAGKTKSSEYFSLKNKFAYREGGVFLLGKNYINGGSRIEMMPLHMISPIIMINMNDKSLFLNLSWEWNTFNNFYFNLGSLLFLGKKTDQFHRSKSEFGAMPSGLFTRLRFYF